MVLGLELLQEQGAQKKAGPASKVSKDAALKKPSSLPAGGLPKNLPKKTPLPKKTRNPEKKSASPAKMSKVCMNMKVDFHFTLSRIHDHPLDNKTILTVEVKCFR